MERWKLNLYTIWIAQIISLTGFGFGLPFMPFYIQELGIVEPDKVKVYSGLLSTAPAVSMAVMSPVWGFLADRYGRKLMLLRAMFFAGFIIAAMGFVSNVKQLIVLRFAQGAFTGTITASSALVACGTPDNKLSYSLGLLSSSTFIGFSLGPIIGGFFAEYAGYRMSFWMGGGMLFLDFLLVLFLVKETEEFKKVDSNSTDERKKGSIKSVLTKTVIPMLITLLFVRIARTVFAPYLPLFVQEMRSMIEGSSRVTGIISGTTGLATALAGLTLSRLGDRYKKTKVICILLMSSIVLSLPLIISKNLLVFAVLYGILFFAIGGVEPVLMSHLSEKTTAEKRGMLFGILGFTSSIGWCISPTLGSLISINYSLKAIFTIIPLIIMLGLITAVFALRSENIKRI